MIDLLLIYFKINLISKLYPGGAVYKIQRRVWRLQNPESYVGIVTFTDKPQLKIFKNHFKK